VRFEGRELLGPGDAAAPARGRGIGFVFQDAGGSLTPHRRIGDQLVEVAMAARGMPKRQACDESLAMLGRVRLPDPGSTMNAYPHELSGGMRQRAAIALALAARPRLLFADEPTSALDVTVQAEVMALLDALCRDFGMALLLVTHDLGVVAALAGRIAVMYAGRIVEEGDTDELLANPAHPYTAGLLASVLSLSALEDGELATIPGAPPRAGETIQGCRFEPRCPRRRERCRVEGPRLEAGGTSRVACHYPLDAGRSP
jgi:oligopeptide transport system ATP-binding protein